MRDWPIGLSTGCFYQTPILDCLQSIQDSGFQMLEICSSPQHLDFRDKSLVTQAAAALRGLHLEPYSFHAPFADDIDITSLDLNQRRFAYREICLAVEAAALLRARYFVLHPGPEKGDIPNSERLQRMDNAVESLTAINARCRELGVSLVLENMLAHLFSGQVRDLLWLLGSLDATDVGICLDTGHAFLARSLPTIVHKLSGHLWMVHASDNQGTYDDHLPPGEGKIAWPDLLRQLSECDFGGCLVLEIAGRGDPERILEGARRARAYLRSLSRRRAAVTVGS